MVALVGDADVLDLVLGMDLGLTIGVGFGRHKYH